ERGAHPLEPRRTACEVDVGIDREAHSGQDILQALDLRTLEADCFGEPQPRLDPARVLATAVMVEYPLHPVAAYRALLAVREDRRILQRNVDLVVEAVRHPAADLLARRLATVQHQIEGMVNVIGAAALAQVLLEFLTCPGLLHRGIRTHSVISRPSQATSIPRRPSSARCADSSSRIGLVLFTCMRILRVPRGSRASHSSIPPGPLCGR